MEWLSAHEIDGIIEKMENKNKLLRLYAISCFLENAFYEESCELDNSWSDLIILTPYAENMIAYLLSKGVSYEDKIMKFALFRLFYFKDIFIDFDKTEEQPIYDIMSEMVKTGQMYWPYIFGNKLYHAFNDTYTGNRTDNLESNIAQSLLLNTSQGVFQVHNLLSGPLGLIYSDESRNILPTLKAPLWHCSDPGCRAAHMVELEQHRSLISDSIKSIQRTLVDDFGLPSEWHKRILRINQNDSGNFYRSCTALPYIISDCIIGDDRKKLCMRAFRSSYNKSLNTIIYSSKRIKGAPEDVIDKLSQEELHQLLMILPDNALIEFIDELVSSKEIKIPPSEVRTPKTPRLKFTNEIDMELSSLGIRYVGHPAIIALASQIWNTYEQIGKIDDISWRVRSHIGPTLRHSIIDFIRVEGPDTAIRELILPSKEVTTLIGERISFKIFTKEQEKHSTTRMLWKFGFNIARYEDDYTILRERISDFKNCILQLSSTPDEKERSKVRSIGVNLFVSVEQFIEDLICYNCWLLSSDHFTGTEFVYTKKDALLTVSKTLGAEINSGGQVIRWCNDGNNTLGGLLAYSQTLRTWLRDRLTISKKDVERNLKDYPFYVNDPVYIFPFNHTELWADIPSTVLNTYIEVFDRIYSQLAQSELSNVRNGIDHKRDDDDFPDPDKMLVCVTRILEALDIADNMRLIPKLYWGKSSTTDSYGNICTTFVDYNNTMVPLWEPSPFPLTIAKPFDVPHIIAPFDLLNMPNSNLAFFVSPRTSYSEYWDDYPRRRYIPKNNLLSDDMTSFAVTDDNITEIETPE